MATTKDGIWTPDQVDDFNLVGDLNTTAATIQSALDKRANAFKGTTSERSQYTSEADEGTIWVDTNGDKSVWVMQGNSWEMVWPERFSRDRKSTRLNSSHVAISYAVFCLKKKNNSRKSL